MQEIYQEISKRIENRYIIKMNNTNALTSRKHLYILLQMWVQGTLQANDTVGDLDLHNNNVRVITLNLANSSYYINADTTREGVLKFLKNKENDWQLIINQKGVRNKVTNTKNNEPIDGFYMYQVIN